MLQRTIISLAFAYLLATPAELMACQIDVSGWIDASLADPTPGHAPDHAGPVAIVPRC
jgi:hypothetical protein